jgi:hypothetical protein
LREIALRKSVVFWVAVDAGGSCEHFDMRWGLGACVGS